LRAVRHEYAPCGLSVEEFLPEEHLSRLVVEIVDQLGLGILVREYAGSGSRPYHR
jgi:hypothetical protein